LDGEQRALAIIDQVISDAPHELAWCFPLAPCEVEADPREVVARFTGATLRIESDGLTTGVEQGWFSPSYGVRRPAPVVRLRGRSEPGEYRRVIVLRVKSP
jgi:Heparinase II/III-like protein